MALNAPITLIAAVIIMGVIIVSAGKASSSIISDHSAETELVALGIRNNMLLAQTAEQGRVIFNTPGNERYIVEIKGGKISATYADATIKQSYKPTVELYHNIKKTVDKELISSSFCIVKKQDDNCNDFIEVCAADEKQGGTGIIGGANSGLCCKIVLCGA